MREFAMNPSLPPDLSSFVEQQVASGAFRTADEVVVAGLRLMQDRERKLAELRAMIQEGMDDFERGDYIELTTPEEYKAFAEDICARGMERLAQREKEHAESANRPDR
jgi:antitoxin ParD1/3/4